MENIDIDNTRKEKAYQFKLNDTNSLLCFESPSWYQGMTMTERIASLHSIQRKTLKKKKINNELAERRIRRWHSQYPFNLDTYFQQRLEKDGVSEEDFFYLLGEPAEALECRLFNTPIWLEKLGRAFSNFSCSESSSLPHSLGGKGTLGFLTAIEPLIHQALNQFREGLQVLIQTKSVLPFNPETVEDILSACLPKQLMMIMSRTMVLELNVARLKGHLQGNNSHERFQNFIKHLKQQKKSLAILQEYPVLARQVTICLNNWVNYSLEFIHHLCEDWQQIKTVLFPEQEPGTLVAIDGNLGDRHREGKSVLIAKFSSGLKIVYKPKSIAVDVHFQELLSWLNERGEHPPFQTLKILERGAYGWLEFVSAQSCTSPEEIERFYQRQGAYLALLYALEATDFHFENLIAVGEHPILLDLEALFHQRLGDIDTTKASHLAISTFSNSVFSTGLLPYQTWFNAESEGIDISGLGAAAGQLTPYAVPQWEGIDTDEMRLVRKKQEIPVRDNQPTLNGAQVNVLDYAEAITIGFTQIYQLLLKHRDELLLADSPLQSFADNEVRVVVRPTLTYSLLLYESFHPDMLRDAIDRDRLFDRLWAGIEHNSHLIKVIPAEQDDLQKGDIPIFTTRPNSCDLWNSSGEQIVGFFKESGMVRVQRRLQQLTQKDLSKQLWFIRASLTTLALEADHKKWPSYHLTKAQAITDKKHLLSAACKVADHLETLALYGESDVSWIGLTLTTKGVWSLAPLGIDLYSGIPGIAMFFAYLGAITEEERYTKIAQVALATMQLQIKERQQYIKSIGAFEVWGGVIYTLTHLGVLWNRSDILAEAEKLVELLPGLIEQDELFDIVGGTAGCIGSLLSLYRYRPSPRLLSVLIQAGNYLISQAQPCKRGIGWLSKNIKPEPLTGFSHGAAGIAWALLELSSLTGEKRFQETALEAIAYERSLFLPEVGNWPDLRNLTKVVLSGKDQQHTCMTAWCHGAPGIGLARLRSLPHLDNPEIRAEINTALKTTLNHGFGSNHSLCHGDLGNLELLLQASQTLNDSQWKTQVDRLSAIILESINKHGWLCGVPLGVETPGLMTGLAGIGYGLLRLVEPELVPSVLVLEPPKLNSSSSV